MPKNPGKRPAKYVIVRNHLLELIRNGLASGSPVPSERELCEQFEVSRMTVRQAIDTLVVDGVLERHQGRGTFVAPPKLDLQVRLTSFTQEMQRRGMEPGVVMLLTETVPAGETVAAALELEADTEVHHLRRLLTANAIPMAIEENWIPAALLPDLLHTSPNFSVYAELTQAGMAPEWGEDMIEAHAATAQEAALLSVQDGAPTLDITRRTFHEHCAIDYSRTLFRADRYTLWVPVAAPKPAFRPSRPRP